MTNWISLFSRTGAEIYQISKRLGKFPDCIITNKPLLKIKDVVPELIDEYDGPWVLLPSFPTVEQYENAFTLTFNKEVSGPDLITLHGYLRILPLEICDRFTMYNGHPGLIDPKLTLFPDLLKGKDPQQKAFDLKLPESGCVIHKVTTTVDSGDIVASRKVSIEGKSLEDVYSILHDTSVDLWVDFLKERL